LTDQRFEMPGLGALARHALPNVVQGVLLPVGVFYLFLWLAGMWGAIIAGLAWSWLAVAYRVVTRQRVPGLLLLGALGLTARTAIAVATESVFIYFLQPTLGTIAMAVAFLFSVPAGRPLAARLAGDFLPMPGWFADHPAIRRFFVRITVLWAGIHLATAGIALWLLISQPVSVYVAAKAGSTSLLWIAGVAGSTSWFLRLLNRHDLRAKAAAPS
jgi:hypothetical protein